MDYVQKCPHWHVFLATVLPNGIMEVEAVRRMRGFRPYSSASWPIRVNPIVLKIPPTCNQKAINWRNNMQPLNEQEPDEEHTMKIVLEHQTAGINNADCLQGQWWMHTASWRVLGRNEGIPRTAGRWGREPPGKTCRRRGRARRWPCRRAPARSSPRRRRRAPARPSGAAPASSSRSSSHRLVGRHPLYFSYSYIGLTSIDRFLSVD